MTNQERWNEAVRLMLEISDNWEEADVWRYQLGESFDEFAYRMMDAVEFRPGMKGALPMVQERFPEAFSHHTGGNLYAIRVPVADGGYYLLGTEDGYERPGDDWFVSLFDADGEEIWTATDSGADLATALEMVEEMIQGRIAR